jgi:hypothetical protein
MRLNGLKTNLNTWHGFFRNGKIFHSLVYNYTNRKQAIKCT